MSWRGTICHETPKRSFTQPHCSASGTAESASAKAVSLGLGLHGYLERDRLIELEQRSAIQASERLTHQRELDHQHVACLARRVVTRGAMDGINMAIGEQRGVEIGGVMDFLSAQRQQRADAAVTQPQPAPKRDAQIDTE